MKDKNRPKGPMSAYACFVQVIREEHKKKHPDEAVVFAEFSKKCAEKWKTMNSKEKQRFDDMSARDKERYNREMRDYVPPDGSRNTFKRKRPKDPNQPKRAWSAFFFFCEVERPKVRVIHPEWRVGEIAKDLGKQWETCPKKEIYEQLAMKDKDRYDQEMIEYRQGIFSGTKRIKITEDMVNSGNLPESLRDLKGATAAVPEEAEDDIVDDEVDDLEDGE